MQREDAIEFSINGAPVRLANRDATLLSALRADLRLHGARFGCGEGHCGACTVVVDGRAVQACQTPVWSLAGANVMTVEGIAHDPRADRVRQAFLDEQAAQCGYCTNGVIMTLAALMTREERPTREEIVAVLDERHLCRCGAHPRILRAIDRLLAGEASAR